MDPRSLTGFKSTAIHARESILGHNGILWPNSVGGIPKQGEELTDLGMDQAEEDRQHHNASNNSATTRESTPEVQPGMFSISLRHSHPLVQPSA